MLQILNCLPVDEAEPDGSFEENRAPVPEGGVDKDDCEEKQMYETSDMDQVISFLIFFIYSVFAMLR